MRAALKTDNLTPSVSRLSRKYGILNVSHSYVSPRPVIGIASFYFIPCKGIGYSFKSCSNLLLSALIVAKFYLILHFTTYKKHATSTLRKPAG
jgi:hypothetical protein